MGKIKAVFVGTGMIGAGLAANAMLNGYGTVLYDVVPQEKMRENISHILDILVEAGAATKAQADQALADCQFSNNLEEAVKGADFVQECIPERLELKKSTYAAIQKVTGPDAVICSSTSKLFPTKLQEDALYPQSILVGHPYNPSYLLPLIELCGGEQTSPEAIQQAKEIYTGMGKVAVVCKKEIYGFIVNRLSWAALEAAKECVRDGVCSVRPGRGRGDRQPGPLHGQHSGRRVQIPGSRLRGTAEAPQAALIPLGATFVSVLQQALTLVPFPQHICPSSPRFQPIYPTNTWHLICSYHRCN